MTERSGWWREYFDDEFAALYAPLLPPERTRWEAEGVADALGLPPGARLLDLGCGWGRHAVELAGMGYRVTGVDLSPALLARAPRGSGAAWACADVRALPFASGVFDAVVSLFSSLGYFLSDEEDERAVREAARVLAPGGVFLLETMHRDQVAREYLDRDWWEGEDGLVVRVEREFDAVAGVSHEVLRWRRGAESGEKRHSIRIRSATEWVDLLTRAGLAVDSVYGDWDLSEFTVEAERLVVTATR